MAKRKTKNAEASSVSDDVMSAQAAADPGNCAQRYQFNMDSQSITPKFAQGTVHPALKGVQFIRNSSDEFEAHIPELAVGTVGFAPGAIAGEWNADSFGNFGSYDLLPNLRDGKETMRKALRWWAIDPLVFKCVKILAQLANTRVTWSSENDDATAMVANWFESVMPHSFRKAWFTEFWRSSMVPTMRTRVPYKPIRFDPNHVPKPQLKMTKASTDWELDRAPTDIEDANFDAAFEITQQGVEEAEEADLAQMAQEAEMTDMSGSDEATAALLKKQEEVTAVYEQAFAAWFTAEEMNKRGLCSHARLEILAKAKAAAEEDWMDGLIPGSYTVFNPLNVDVRGPAEMPWLRQAWLIVGQDLRNVVTDPTQMQKNILAKLPADIMAGIKRGDAAVALSPAIFAITYGEKQPYERYPTPIAFHADWALEMKYLLLEMDKVTAKSMRDRILKVTIGSDAYPAFDNEQLQALAQIFNSPSRNLTIFWNHTLNIEWIEPANQTFNDISKYEVWNAEIRTAFGISEVVTGTSGTSGAIGNSMLNLKGVKEEVEDGQGSFVEFLQHEVDLFRAAIGLKWKVTAKFDRLNMEDETTFMSLLMNLVMNGIIDHQTAIETMDFSFPAIQDRMEKIKKLQKAGTGIFLPTPSANNLGPGAAQKGGGIPTGGKPKAQPKPANKQKQGKSQPKTNMKTTKPTKAKARLVAGDDGITAYLVVATEEMDQDSREIVAEKFALPTQYVLTEAEYTKATGKTVNWLSVLPTLSTGELMAVMAKANDIMAEVHVQTADAVEAFKKNNPGGTRGKYVTATVKRKIADEVLANILNTHRSREVAEMEYAERLALACQEISGGAMNDATDQQKLTAVLMLESQYGKAAAKA